MMMNIKPTQLGYLKTALTPESFEWFKSLPESWRCSSDIEINERIPAITFSSASLNTEDVLVMIHSEHKRDPNYEVSLELFKEVVDLMRLVPENRNQVIMSYLEGKLDVSS